MLINYRGNVGQFLNDQLNRLSPSRREPVENAVIINADQGYEKFIDSLLDNDPEVIELLKSPEIRQRLLLEVAGDGYRAIESPISDKTGKIGIATLVPDTPNQFGELEQALVELNSLKRELDYEVSGGNLNRSNYNQILVNSLDSGLDQLGQRGITSTGKGGIQGIKHTEYGTRDKHPALPELTQENARQNVIAQLMDNLLGNPRGEQPVGMINESGKAFSIPVEHIKAFQENPELGYETLNRMLGSTSKNSIIRNEKDPQRRQVLLNAEIAKRETELENLTGKKISELEKELGYVYKPIKESGDAIALVQKYAGDALMPLINKSAGTSSRVDSPGANRERALVINSEGGDVTIGEGVLRSNGNGKVKGNGKH